MGDDATGKEEKISKVQAFQNAYDALLLEVLTLQLENEQLKKELAFLNVINELEKK